jgi:methionyl-tRNA synthetase
MSRFYVTTAIDYPNGAPHLGHLYEKVIADTYARWYRFLGREVYFLTGTDENGQKLSRSAQEAGASTKEYVDQNADKFRKLCLDLKLTNDDFIRTTEERHITTVHKIWKLLKSSDDIYFDRYQGLYCIACEAFYPESQAESGQCPQHGTKLEFMEEDGYFFRLSRYQDWIIQYIREHQRFVFPHAARKEILSRLELEPLKDLSISRPNQGWGISVPDDPGHVIYTWFDALINYYAVADQDKNVEAFWPANMHVIGKDITWFHAVIWPVMLHAAKIPLPEQVYVHGMLLAADGRKMSKSLGNVVDPYELMNQVSNDLIRYHMARTVPSGQDGAFSVADLVHRYNTELANDLGNLVMRVVKLTAKRIGNSFDDHGLSADLNYTDSIQGIAIAMEDREHHRALDQIWEIVGRLNAYLNTHEPWRIKDDEAKFRHHMINCVHGISVISELLEAFLPETSRALKQLILVKSSDPLEPVAGIKIAKFGSAQYQLSEPEALFPRLEITEEGKIQKAPVREKNK